MSIVTDGPNGKNGGDGILAVTSKTRIRRGPTRAVLEREVMNQIIDEC